MTSIGTQATTIFGGRVIVSVNSSVLGMADTYKLTFGYGVDRHPIFNAYVPAYLTKSLIGTLQIDGLYTTDNVLYGQAQKANFVSGGDLAITTVTVQEFDTSIPSANKLITCTGRMSPWERDGKADNFSTFRFTLELNAEPTFA